MKKFWNKETINDQGEFYRNGDWSIEMPDDWDNSKNNFTDVSPPAEAFEGISCEWDEDLGDWVLDVVEKERVEALTLLESTDIPMTRVIEDLIDILKAKEIISDDDLSQTVKDRIAARKSAREDI